MRWLSAGERVWVTTRSPNRAVELARLGLRPIVGDLTQGLALPTDASPIDSVLFAAGFRASVGEDLPGICVAGLKHALDSLSDDVVRFIYASSTGVYGQEDGSWVDEQSPTQPTRASGVAYLAAENFLAQHRLANRRIVLRFAGLYGPGRVPKASAIERGEPIETPPSHFLNLIHIDDAADVVVQLDQCVTPPQMYVVSDGEPVLRSEFYGELARLLKAPGPQFCEPGPESSKSNRSMGNKRIRPTRLKSVLQRPLTYPSYRAGLAAVVQQLS
jgi:nucleoside-diphosphate-sugar epimerase